MFYLCSPSATANTSPNLKACPSPASQNCTGLSSTSARGVRIARCVFAGRLHGLFHRDVHVRRGPGRNQSNSSVCGGAGRERKMAARGRRHGLPRGSRAHHGCRLVRENSSRRAAHPYCDESEDLLGRGAHRSDARYKRHSRRSEEHTSELQSPCNLVCRLLLEKKKKQP